MGLHNLNSTIQKSRILREKVEDAVRDVFQQCQSSYCSSCCLHSDPEAMVFTAQDQKGHLHAESTGYSACLHLEIRNLMAIGDALQVFEEWLRFLERLQSQQEVEKYSALVRLEQSRQFLVKRLVEHNGRDRPVIQEALEFARAADKSANLHPKESIPNGNNAHLQKKHTNTTMMPLRGFISFIISPILIMKKPFRLLKAAGSLVGFGVAAVGTLLALQLQQRNLESSKMHKMMLKRNVGSGRESIINSAARGRTRQIRRTHMDVLHGRG
ncbi:plastid division protein PDV1-like [Nymphaea colorata]|nr:plastid division protein PDV1-like [Nymphaea colorata]